ncbi:MAG: hypothetical protein IJP92_06630 [Lachnospiraceae bacterium]|nr:hypothetical protein [Lachnospiraceae bacterium]
MMMDGTVRVATQILAAKAESVDTLLNMMEQDFRLLGTVISRTSSYWTGEMSDEYRRDYLMRHEEIVEMMERLRRFPVELRTIAGIYNDSDAAIAATGSALPVDVL